MKTGEVAFPAGCVTVTYDPILNQQSRFTSMVPQESGKLKPITSVTYSPDGRRMACSECGHQPSIYIWNLESNTLSVELKAHSLGIACMSFIQGGKMLVTMGTEHDQQLNVWDLRTSSPLRTCKLTSKIHALAANEDGTSFATVGLRHLKIWNVDLSGSAISGSSFKQHEFVDAIWGRGALNFFLYTISREGVLFVIDTKTRTEALRIDLKTTSYGLTMVDKFIAVACARGAVRLLNAATLEYVATLPKPNPIGVEFATIADTHLFKQATLNESGSSHTYPDTIAVKASLDHKHVFCFYNNRSLFIWDISNVKQVAKYRSFISNSSCVWGLDMFPSMLSVTSSSNPIFPEGSFATCSADGSIRIWNTSSGSDNVYSRELWGSLSLSSAEEVYQGLVSSGPVDGLGGSLIGSTTTAMGLASGVRSVCISPDGEEIASGDRSGNVRIHRTADFSLCSLQEAHESEVLCLSYNKDSSSTSSSDNTMLLASGSRDRLIHVFARSGAHSEVTKAFKKANVTGIEGGVGYTLVSTMDDHSASITAVAFSEAGTELFSSSADKSAIFRHVSSDGQTIKRYNNMVTQGVMLDMKVVPNKPWIVLAGQDKKIAIHDSASGTLLRTIPTQSDADILKLEIDNTGLLLATASQDRVLRLYNFATGELLSSMAGHSEIITAVKFSFDGSQIYTASGDGCIFVWAVSSELATAMKSRRKALSGPPRPKSESSSPSSMKTPTSKPNSVGANGKSISRRGLAPSPQGSVVLSPPSSSGRISSTSAQALLERIISPAYLPGWAQSSASAKRNSGATTAARQSAWTSRSPQTFNMATSEEYSKSHGSLDLSLDNRRLSIDPASLLVPATAPHPGVFIARCPSPQDADKSNDMEPIIFPAEDDSREIGPVIRADGPSASTSITTANDDDFNGTNSEDPAAFFEEIQRTDTDFLHEQNFGNLNQSFVPTTSTHQGRKSISARYFLKRPPISKEEGATATSEDSMAPLSPRSGGTLPLPTTPKPSQNPDVSAEERREQMAREVERTKARLREMGIHFGTKPSPAPKTSKSVLSSSNQAIEPILMSTTSNSTVESKAGQASPLRAASTSHITKSMGDLPILQITDEVIDVDDESAVNGDVEVEEQGEEVVEDDSEMIDDAAAEEEYLDDDTPARPAFLQSLMGGFDRTVELYRELKESEDQGDMVLQFRSVFAEMKATLDILSSEDNILSSMASDRTYELTGSTTLECTEAAMLERYSEMLVGLVRNKLGGSQ